jgi:YD repeat-containing protein
LNRVTSASYSDGSSATYLYDQGSYALGRLSKITDVAGTTEYGYDQHGRVLSEIRTIGGQACTTAYRYDQHGRLSGMTYPSGRSIDYVRDEAGRIKEIRTTKDGAPALLVSQVSYQPFGPLQSLVFGNGQTYSRTYDLDGRMVSYTLNGQAQTLAYDAASRITGVTDGGNAGNNRSYGYDELDRITSEQRPQRSLGYSYDAVGNRTKYVNGAATTNYTYGTTSNRLMQYSGSQNATMATDANGSTTSNGPTGFNYDARGRLVSANTAIGLVTYKINAHGQRVQKITPNATTVFHYDGSGKLIAESTDGALTEYVYLDDMPVAVLK